MPRHPTIRRHSLACLLALLTASTAAAEPTALPHLGIFLDPPPGSIVSTRRIETAEITAIALGNGLGTVLIQNRNSPSQTATAADLERGLIAGLLGLPADQPIVPAAFNPGPMGRLLPEITEMGVAGRQIRVLYLELVPEAGRNVRPIRGFAVWPATSGFVVFELATTSDQIEAARPVFQALLETVTANDLDLLDTDVIEAVRTGTSLMLGLDDEDYAQALAGLQDRLERLYTPGASAEGDVEHGYRQIRGWIGPMGELVEKPKQRWKAAEAAEGYCVRIDAKLLLPSGASATSSSRFFLSRDRREEFWSVEIGLVLKPGDRPDVWREHGTRNGAEMTVFIDAGRGELSVINPDMQAPSLDSIRQAEGRSGTTIAKPEFRLEGYVSRVDAELLPRLLARSGAAGNYAFSTYDSDLQAVKFFGVRYDAAPGGADAGGASVRVRSPSAGDRVFAIDGAGEVATVSLADGRVWEPITPEALRDLYRRKGLPTD